MPDINPEGGGGCSEYAQFERRAFLRAARAGWQAFAGSRGGKLAGAAALTGATTTRATFAANGGPSRDVILYVMLRGGMDGMSLCVPYADPDYGTMRGALALAPPGQLNGVLDLDGFFGLNANAAELEPIYQAGELSFIHNVGSPNPSRSHFESMKLIESGSPDLGSQLLTDGWLGRHLNVTPEFDPDGTLRGLAIAFTQPQTMVGGPKTLTIPDPSNFVIGGFPNSRLLRRSVIRAMYDVREDPIRSVALDSLDTIESLAAIDFENYVPAGGASYPLGELGDRFSQAAAMIKADIGLEAIQIDSGGWDHHAALGPVNGTFATMIQELSQTLAAFRTDLGSLGRSVTTVVMSEFGRRVDTNGSLGTDHGRAGCMMLMGRNVNGGQVVHDWTGLDPQVLDDLALPVTIDYRDVALEVLQKRAANQNAGAVFPNHMAVNRNLVS